MDILKEGYSQLVMRPNNKISFKDFTRESIQLFYRKFGFFPKRIVMHKKDNDFLGKNRGVSYKGNKIIVASPKYALREHLYLYKEIDK